MTLRSRLAAIETAARRRRWRHTATMLPAPPMKFDETDPQYIAVMAKVSKLLADQPVSDPMQLTAGCGPIERMQAEIGTARLIMADPKLAAEYRALLRKGMAAADAAPVSDTGASERE